MTKKETNLFVALGKFIEAFRLYIYTGLRDKHGDSWERLYFESLYHEQKEQWGKNLQEGFKPIDLIDYGNLAGFALKQKQKNGFFFEYFGYRESNNLVTIFNQMAEARNALMHYLPFDNDKAEKAYLHMIGIAQKLEMDELEASLRKLKNDSFNELKITEKTRTSRTIDKRLYTNTEIQIKITEKAKTLTDAELKRLCDKDYSKSIFNNNYSILIRVPENATDEIRNKAIRDHNLTARWTWRYEFRRFGYDYAVTTQWYPRQDLYVKEWLNS